MSWLPDGGNILNSTLGSGLSYGNAEAPKKEDEPAAIPEAVEPSVSESLSALDNVRQAISERAHQLARGPTSQYLKIEDQPVRPHHFQLPEGNRGPGAVGQRTESDATRLVLAADRAPTALSGSHLHRVLGFVDAVRGLKQRDLPPGGVVVPRDLLPPVGVRRFYMPWAAAELQIRITVPLRDPIQGDRAVYYPHMGDGDHDEAPSERELLKYYRLLLQPTLKTVDQALRQRFAVYIRPNLVSVDDHFTFARSKERLFQLLYPRGADARLRRNMNAVDLAEALSDAARELVGYYQHVDYARSVMQDGDRLARSILLEGGRECAAEILLDRHLGAAKRSAAEMMRATIARVGQDAFLRAFFSGDPEAERSVVETLRRILEEHLAYQRTAGLHADRLEVRFEGRHQYFNAEDMASAALPAFEQGPDDDDQPQRDPSVMPEAIVGNDGHTLSATVTLGTGSYRILYGAHKHEGGHLLVATAPEVDPDILITAKVRHLGPTDTVTVTSWQAGALRGEAGVQLLTSLFRQYGVYPTHQLVLHGFASHEVEGLWRRSRHPYESEIGERARRAIIDLQLLPTDAFFVVRGPDKQTPIVDVVIGIDRNSVGPRLRTAVLQQVDVANPRYAELIALDAAFRSRARHHLTGAVLPAWQRALMVPGAEFEKLYAAQAGPKRPVQAVHGFVTYDTLGAADTVVLRSDLRPSEVEQRLRLPRVNLAQAIIAFYAHPDFLQRMRALPADPRQPGSNMADGLIAHLAWRMAGARAGSHPDQSSEYLAAFLDLKKAAETHPIDPAYLTWNAETYLGEQAWQAAGDDLGYKACFEGDAQAISTLIDLAREIVRQQQQAVVEWFVVPTRSAPVNASEPRAPSPVAQPQPAASPWASPFKL